MIEYERTFLAAYIPQDIESFPSKEISDNQIPKESENTQLRIRKIGEEYKITKKTPLRKNDKSECKEETIELSEWEYTALNKYDGKKLRKQRYYYPRMWKEIEIDIFKDELSWLVMIDIEYEKKDAMIDHPLPDFCAKEITKREDFVGWRICGKSYQDLEPILESLGYKKLALKNK